MINNVVETWHGIISGANPEALNDLLADDVVFTPRGLHPTARQAGDRDVLAGSLRHPRRTR